MKFIKVRTNSYKNKTLVPKELKFFTEYGNETFVLRKLPDEKLPQSLIDVVCKSGIVTRSDGVEYVICDRRTFKEHLKVKMPITCSLILIRTTYIAKKPRRPFKYSIPWLRKKCEIIRH